MTSSLVKFQLRSDTTTNWISNNPTISSGEPCYASDTKSLKIGDGTNSWTNLISLTNNTSFVNVKSLGAIGDGGSHPLSTIYSTFAKANNIYSAVFNAYGINSSNYSTVEVDWAAIQTAIYYSNSSVYIPTGVYQLGNNELTISGSNINIIGAGKTATVLTSTQRVQVVCFKYHVRHIIISDLTVRCDYAPPVWNSATTYAINAPVSYLGNIYTSIGNNNTNVPTTSITSGGILTSASYTFSGTFTSSNNTIVVSSTFPSQNTFVINQTIKFSSLPGGMSAFNTSTTYYVVNVTSNNTISLSATSGGTAITADVSGSTTGTVGPSWVYPFYYGNMYSAVCDMKYVTITRCYFTNELSPYTGFIGFFTGGGGYTLGSITQGSNQLSLVSPSGGLFQAMAYESFNPQTRLYSNAIINGSITGTTLTINSFSQGSTSYISTGMYVTGSANIYPGTYIVSGSGNTWILSSPVISTITNTTLTISVGGKLQVTGSGIPSETYSYVTSYYSTSSFNASGGYINLIDKYGNPVYATSTASNEEYSLYFTHEHINILDCTFTNTGYTPITWLDQTHDNVSRIKNINIERCNFNYSGMSGLGGNGQAISMGAASNVKISNNYFNCFMMGIEFFMSDSLIEYNRFDNMPLSYTTGIPTAIYAGNGPYGTGYVTYACSTLPTGIPIGNSLTSSGNFYTGNQLIVSGLTGTNSSQYNGYNVIKFVDANITINGVPYAYALTTVNSNTNSTAGISFSGATMITPCAAGQPLSCTGGSAMSYNRNKIIKNVCLTPSQYTCMMRSQKDLIMEANEWYFSNGGYMEFTNVNGLRASNDKYFSSINCIKFDSAESGIGSFDNQFVNCSFDNSNALSSYSTINLSSAVSDISFLGCLFNYPTSGSYFSVGGGISNPLFYLCKQFNRTSSLVTTSTATTSIASNILTLSSSNSSILGGYLVTGTGIPANTYVVSVSSTQLSLVDISGHSQYATQSNTGTYSFYSTTLTPSLISSNTSSNIFQLSNTALSGYKTSQLTLGLGTTQSITAEQLAVSVASLYNGATPQFINSSLVVSQNGSNITNLLNQTINTTNGLQISSYVTPSNLAIICSRTDSANSATTQFLWNITAQFFNNPTAVLSLPSTYIPTIIPGCVWWLDGSDNSTMYQSDGTQVTALNSIVSTWYDKSGIGNHAYQNTNAGLGKPICGATYTANGLTFANQSGYTFSPSLLPSGTSNASYFIVMNTALRTAIPVVGTSLTVSSFTNYAAITGYISGTTLTVSSVVSGQVSIGQLIGAPGITAGTYIVSGSGTSWVVSISQTVGSSSSPITISAAPSLYMYYSITNTSFNAFTVPTLLTTDNGLYLSLINNTASTLNITLTWGGTVSTISGTGFSSPILTITPGQVIQVTQSGTNTLVLTSTTQSYNGTIMNYGTYSSNVGRTFAVSGSASITTALVGGDNNVLTTSNSLTSTSVVDIILQNGGDPTTIAPAMTGIFYPVRSIASSNSNNYICLTSGTGYASNVAFIPTFTSSATYTANVSLVLNSGTYYLCTTNTGPSSFNAPSWLSITPASATAWSPSSAYTYGQCVTYLGTVYVCTNSGGISATITSPPLAGASNWISTPWFQISSWIPWSLTSSYITGYAATYSSQSYYCAQTPKTLSFTFAVNSANITVSSLSGFLLSVSQAIILTSSTTTGTLNFTNTTSAPATTYYILSTTGTGNGAVITLGTSIGGTAITSGLTGAQTGTANAMVFTGTPGIDTQSWNTSSITTGFVDGTNGVASMMRFNSGVTSGLLGYSFAGLNAFGEATSNFTGNINEIIVYNTPLTTLSRQLIEGYLAWKWSGSGSILIAGHPYKSTKPLP